MLDVMRSRSRPPSPGKHVLVAPRKIVPWLLDSVRLRLPSGLRRAVEPGWIGSIHVQGERSKSDLLDPPRFLP
jgi:hypothetical protein